MQEQAPRPALTRRDFLAATAATGAALSLSSANLAYASSADPGQAQRGLAPPRLPAPGTAVSDVYRAIIGGVDVAVERLNFGDGLHVLWFAAKFPVEVRLRCLYNRVPSAQVRPVRDAPPFECRGQEVIFTLDRPRHLVVDIPNWPRVVVFADSDEDVARTAPSGEVTRFDDAAAIQRYDAPGFSWQPDGDEPLQAALDARAAAGGGTVVLDPGLYEYPRGDDTPRLVVPADVTLHLEPGATLAGRLIAVRGDNAAITGQGVLSGRGLSRGPRMQRNHRFLSLERGRNMRLDGVRVEQTPYWAVFIAQCQDVQVTNVKNINMYLNMVLANDGINVVNSQRVKVDRFFYFGADDAVNIKGFGGRADIRDIVFSNVVCLTSCGAAKIGSESAARTITDSVFRDIDVLDCGRAALIMLWDPVEVRGIRFENIHVERCRGSNRQRLIDIVMGDPEANRTNDRAVLEDIELVNFASREMSARPMRIAGHSAERPVRNVTFRGLEIAGKPVRTEDDADFEICFAENVRLVDGDGKAHVARSLDRPPVTGGYDPSTHGPPGRQHDGDDRP